MLRLVIQMDYFFEDPFTQTILVLIDEPELFEQITKLPFREVKLREYPVFKGIKSSDFKGLKSNVGWNQLVINFVSELDTEIGILLELK